MMGKSRKFKEFEETITSGYIGTTLNTILKQIEPYDVDKFKRYLVVKDKDGIYYNKNYLFIQFGLTSINSPKRRNGEKLPATASYNVKRIKTYEEFIFLIEVIKKLCTGKNRVLSYNKLIDHLNDKSFKICKPCDNWIYTPNGIFELFTVLNKFNLNIKNKDYIIGLNKKFRSLDKVIEELLTTKDYLYYQDNYHRLFLPDSDLFYKSVQIDKNPEILKTPIVLKNGSIQTLKRVAETYNIRPEVLYNRLSKSPEIKFIMDYIVNSKLETNNYVWYLGRLMTLNYYCHYTRFLTDGVRDLVKQGIRDGDLIKAEYPDLPKRKVKKKKKRHKIKVRQKSTYVKDKDGKKHYLVDILEKGILKRSTAYYRLQVNPKITYEELIKPPRSILYNKNLIIKMNESEQKEEVTV